MNEDEDLFSLARSDAWRDRARAGEELSLRAGVASADDLLAQLLLDARDTAVIARTAGALLAVNTEAALRVFVAAWPRAEPSQADHLSGALSGALFEASLDPREAERLRISFSNLLTDDTEDVRLGARLLFDRVVAALAN